MILAKARLIAVGGPRVRVGLSFPTGFQPEEVVRDSVRANGSVKPADTHIDPRSGSPSDIYREFEVSFPAEAVIQEPSTGALKITGRFKRGIPFSATVPVIGRGTELDH